MILIPCCESFGELLANAGQKGAAVVPRVRAGHRLFFLQMRPFDPDVLALLSATDPTTGKHRWPSLEQIAGRVVPFVAVMALPLRYCPSCGTRLETIIQQNVTAFDEVAQATVRLWES